MKNNDILSRVDAQVECPPATQDIVLNLKNRQNCINIANYGPANPNEDDEAYWQKKADQFKTTVEQAKTMRCSNCAAFVVKEKIIQCIQKGIASEHAQNPETILNPENTFNDAKDNSKKKKKNGKLNTITEEDGKNVDPFDVEYAEKSEPETDELESAKEIIDLADLGYCELFDFKCAGSRTCDAWLVNGPLKD